MISELQSPIDDETPIDRLLREQNRLQTPVAKFSEKFDSGEADANFRELIPLENPKPGEQFAFEVDLDRCTGCKACVAGCHSLNGLEENETWRDVGLIQGLSNGKGYQQTVTTACHHCVDAGCLNGCPVNAYEKDPVTGIVLHLDDQCIGCQYCVLKCPYDVPKYSERLGIVRKCDMCYSRLSVGEAPACVQSCPTEAIRIVTVDKESLTKESVDPSKPAFLPAAPHQSYTLPTTSYVSDRDVPADAKAGDETVLRPQHPHWPLIIMLTLTQASVGVTGAAVAWSGFGVGLFVASSLLAGVGLAASVLHLGQPLRAWRVFLGLTHSWLSREIVVFGAFAPMLFLLTGLQFTTLQDKVPGAFGWLAFLVGLTGVFTSVMIYADTQRAFWKFERSALRFFGTTLIAMGAGGWIVSGHISAALWLVAGVLAKFCLDALGWLDALDNEFTPDKHSALIQLTREPEVVVVRWLLSFIGAAMVLFIPTIPYALGGAVLLLGGEIAERYLFFRAVAASKMPGGIRA
ncbi:MAG: DmsC/YnfH family molybdoenzyme membrane anchor subunit [Verrucomicrobiota bacterium]